MLHQKPSKGPHTLRPPARPPLNITLRQRVRRIYLPPLFGEHLGVCGRISWSCALSRPCAACRNRYRIFARVAFYLKIQKYMHATHMHKLLYKG